ncbi:MAG: FG-GAP repeat domain-containing protein, partial [Verrucomicrobiales bacterium]
MAARFQNIDRQTPRLQPECLQDWIPENDHAHIVIDAVAALQAGELIANGEDADSTPLEDGLSIPQEMARRGTRKARWQAAREVIEARERAAVKKNGTGAEFPGLRKRRPALPRTAIVLAAGAVMLAGCGKKEESGGGEGEGAGIKMAAPVPLEPGEVRKEPLSPRQPGPGGTALFEPVSAEKSGLDFRHRWAPRHEAEKNHLNSSFSGGGVALGDVDHDGLPEVFLTRPHGGSRLYRNLGNFKFEDITARMGLEQLLANHWSISGSFVDIQGDGYLDLYVCGYETKNLLFINDGKGRYAERAADYGLAFAGASLFMTFADYDRDGDLDAYLLTNRLTGKGRPEKLDFKVLPSGEVIVPEPYRDELGALLKPDGTLHQH